MKTVLQRAQEVTAPEIDRRLSEGWYRVGQYWMTCRVLLNDSGLRSTVWTRVDIQQHTFKRSHRKLLRQWDRQFQVREGPATVDPPREALYARYVASRRGQRSATLSDFLLGDASEDAFSTRELSIWDGERLIGFSCFDVGVTSMQSLIGVFDPQYARQSIGFATVLMELRESHRLGLQYHYTGYVLPGDPSMDYKLRPGAIEFLDQDSGDWHPWDRLDLSTLPAEQIADRLEQASASLIRVGVRSQIKVHHHYRLQASNALLFDQPVALRVGAAGPREVFLGWDVDLDCYRLYRTVRSMVRLVSPEQDDSPIPVWVVQHQTLVSNLSMLPSAVDRIRSIR